MGQRVFGQAFEVDRAEIQRQTDAERSCQTRIETTRFGDLFAVDAQCGGFTGVKTARRLWGCVGTSPGYRRQQGFGIALQSEEVLVVPRRFVERRDRKSERHQRALVDAAVAFREDVPDFENAHRCVDRRKIFDEAWDQ